MPKDNIQDELSAFCKKECGMDAKAVADYAEIPPGHFMIGGAADAKLCN